MRDIDTAINEAQTAALDTLEAELAQRGYTLEKALLSVSIVGETRAATGGRGITSPGELMALLLEASTQVAKVYGMKLDLFFADKPFVGGQG